MYLHFQNKKKSLMKPDIFDSKPFPGLLLQLYHLHNIIIFLHALFYTKNRKTEDVREYEIKPNEISYI